MSRRTAFALVALLWAAIYLPGLGSTEIKGEEGRRILPAIAMLESGNWIVPYIGGEPYLRKPPLVNWAIALSFKVTGVRNEWTARLPSALCVLALGLTIVALASRPRDGSPGSWLDVETSLMAALMAMTPFGLLAKARFAGAEIEGIYAPLTGMAIVCWLAWRAQGRSPWLVWCVPGVLLGLACLAKGPSLHLLFFYAIVIAVLWREKALRELVQPAHLVGLALCAAIFAAWAVPYFRSPEAATAAEVWKRQGLDRFTDSDFNLRNYLTNIPRALGDLLPWLLIPLAAFAWRRGAATAISSDEARWRLMAGTFTAIAICFFGVLLIPGTLPRYVLPLGAPIALLLAEMAAASDRVLWNRWLRLNQILAVILAVAGVAIAVAVKRFETATAAASEAGRLGRLSPEQQVAMVMAIVSVATALFSGWDGVHRVRPTGLVVRTCGLIAAACLLHTALVLTWLRRHDDLRPAAAAIDAAIPDGAELIVHDPGYFPALFYLRTPYRYAPRTEDIPADAGWVLARIGERRKLAAQRPDLQVVTSITGKGRHEMLLFHR